MLDKKRQNILLKGRYKIEESLQKIPIKNISMNTTEVSLFYAIDNDNYTSIDHVIDLQQDFRTVQKNIPFSGLSR